MDKQERGLELIKLCHRWNQSPEANLAYVTAYEKYLDSYCAVAVEGDVKQPLNKKGK